MSKSYIQMNINRFSKIISRRFKHKYLQRRLNFEMCGRQQQLPPFLCYPFYYSDFIFTAWHWNSIHVLHTLTKLICNIYVPVHLLLYFFGKASKLKVSELNDKKGFNENIPDIVMSCERVLVIFHYVLLISSFVNIYLSFLSQFMLYHFNLKDPKSKNT